jgi:hypothetical protein
MVVQLYSDEFIFREALQRMHVEKLKRMNFFENPLGIHFLFCSFLLAAFFRVIKKIYFFKYASNAVDIHIHKKILYGEI